MGIIIYGLDMIFILHPSSFILYLTSPDYSRSHYCCYFIIVFNFFEDHSTHMGWWRAPNCILHSPTNHKTCPIYFCTPNCIVVRIFPPAQHKSRNRNNPNALIMWWHTKLGQNVCLRCQYIAQCIVSEDLSIHLGWSWAPMNLIHRPMHSILRLFNPF